MANRDLNFPWWIGLVSWFQPHGNDNLTRSERRHLARKWRRGAGSHHLSKADRQAVQEYLAAKRFRGTS